MSEFDDLMAEADELIWQTVGTECQLVRTPGAEPETLLVDLQRNLTAQQLGEKGRAGNGQRLSTLLLGAVPERQMPADIKQARLLVDDLCYVLTEPVNTGGDIEFLLVPEVAAETSGSRATTFLR
ncbi:MAG: hypothetical protein OIF57_04205 [Marinobacterium sp.]|nr:hypothetical protein [Marinobacterium sp.]